jgi:hypothetical protein
MKVIKHTETVAYKRNSPVDKYPTADNVNRITDLAVKMERINFSFELDIKVLKNNYN